MICCFPFTGTEQIEQQTDYLFIYNTNEIDLNRKASVHAQDQTVMDVLSQIFRNTNIGYAIEGSNIMLMKKDEKAEQQQDNNKVSGTITDKSGEPIIGANVVIKGTTNGTITDIDGNYTLDVPVSAILQISYIGYLTQDVPECVDSLLALILMRIVCECTDASKLKLNTNNAMNVNLIIRNVLSSVLKGDIKCPLQIFFIHL